MIAKINTGYTSQQIKQLTLPVGKWFINVAPLGEKPLWFVGNPPHMVQDDLIFGRTWNQIKTMQRGGKP